MSDDPHDRPDHDRRDEIVLPGAGIEAVDAELATRLSPEGVAGLRRGLFALIEIREEMEDPARRA